MSSHDEQIGAEHQGVRSDSVPMPTRPGGVLLTGLPEVRLTPVYKVNINKRDHSTFIGENRFHYHYSESERWHGNLMPGLEAVFGYNMVNVAHYQVSTGQKTKLFAAPVLIRNLYYPSFTTDTLSGQPVQRDYILVSVYNEDTNGDGFIDLSDLRRFYHFNGLGEMQKPLVPENYAVVKSEYDPGNDMMFVYAQLDANKNGKRDDMEPMHIFWIDLKDPNRTGRFY